MRFPLPVGEWSGEGRGGEQRGAPIIDRRALKPLTLGPQDVERLIPHRQPLLLVDGVEAIATEPPALKAFKHIAITEPVFAGHFPEEPLWPGAYCIEGLAQTCALLVRSEPMENPSARCWWRQT